MGSRRWLFVVLGLASSAGFLWLAFARLEFDDVRAAFRQADLVPWLPLAALSYLAGHFVRGLRCRLLASQDAKLTTLTATNVVVLGYAVNNIAPARLGEFARAAMLTQRSGLPYIQSLSLTFLERIMDGLVMLALLAVALWALPVGGWVTTTMEFASVVFGIAFVGVLLAVTAGDYLVRFAGQVGQIGGRRVHDRLVHAVNQAVQGVRYLRAPRAALVVVLLSGIVWLFEAGMFLCLLPAFGLEPSPWVALLAMTVTNLGILVPSSPGFIGPFHFFCKEALGVVGVAEAVGLSYAALVHLTFYVPITAWGVVILLVHGFHLSSAMQARAAASPLALPDLDDMPPPPDLPPNPEAREITRALCEALVPVDSLSAESRHEVLLETSAFVEGQLEALPARLRVLYQMGILGVRLITRIVFVRSLCGLPLERRRRWVEKWAYGSFGLGRQLFRAIRATALLAYYEHPLVRAELAATTKLRPKEASSRD